MPYPERSTPKSARPQGATTLHAPENGYIFSYSIFAFTVVLRAPSIPLFSAEWVGYQ